MAVLQQKTARKHFMDRMFCAMGTINAIKTFDGEEEALTGAVERVLELDDRMSAFKKSSDVSLLRENAGCGFVRLHRDTFGLLRRAREFSALSAGTFDVTVRPLIELWGIGKKANYIPSEREIEAARSLTGYKSILLCENSSYAALEHPGQSVALGSAAKGYAADEVKRILLENGVTSGMINLGGNVAAIGSRPDGSPWRVGIQNPLAPSGQYLCVLSVRDKTVVTSGVNERFFIKGGVRYHHIMDPRTGKPAQNGFLSVSVAASDSAAADMLSTALFILGPSEGGPLLKRFGAGAVFITKDMKIHKAGCIGGELSVSGFSGSEEGWV